MALVALGKPIPTLKHVCWFHIGKPIQTLASVNLSHTGKPILVIMFRSMKERKLLSSADKKEL